jgi:site-specific DNA recombinase
MSAKGNGGTYHYYACSGRQKLGPKGCDGERLSKDKLETAILDQLTSLYRHGGLIRDAIQQAAASDETDRDALAEQRASLTKEISRTERAIERYQNAFEAGNLNPARFNERLSSLDARLDSLRGQDQTLALELAADTPTTPDTAALNAVADQLGRVIETGDPDQAKALLRILISELRVNSRSEILPTYRVGAPVVCAQTSSVGDTGLEPVTSALSIRPAAQTTTTYAAEPACLLGFPATSEVAAPCCPASFVGSTWEVLWESARRTSPEVLRGR